MQSRDYMYIQVLVLLVGAYRDQMCICIVRNALMCIRLGSTNSNYEAIVISKARGKRVNDKEKQSSPIFRV